MTTYQDLPAPEAPSLKRSEALRSVIQQKIQQHNGKITFADYMQLALYHSEYGYYQSRDFALGSRGDFTTAPEISPLFAKCFARQCQEIMATQGSATILELGAGTGRFALDLMTELAARHALPERYQIYEISPALRQQQQTLLQAAHPAWLSRVEWLPALPQQITGIVIANEVLDAIPFQCFQIENQQMRERMVVVANEEFAWSTDAPSSPIFQGEIAKLKDEYALADGYQSEIQLPAMQFVQQLCDALQSGVILLADYGYGQREYYHPQRSRGTLSCFYQHRTHDNPFLYPGLQDITTHVDFTRVIETASACGVQLAGFTTQCAFLLANGLIEMAQAEEQQLSEADAFRLHQAIKVLTMPTEMGDLVKVMALSKNFSEALAGFKLLDRRRDL